MSILSDLGDIASDYINQKSWAESLRKASYRGVPFGVFGGDFRAGRRVAVHQYPGRDKPYIEDMGRSTRLIRLTGFLVTDSLVYGGGEVKSQRDAMVAAVERAGPGTLVHPTLGNLTVSVPDGGLQVIEKWDHGRYFEINLTFIESGERVFPATRSSTVSLLDKLAKAFGLSAALDFVRKVIGGITAAINMVEGVIRFGKAIVSMVVSVVAGFQELVGRIQRDARSIMGLAGLMTGNYGRYANGSVSSALVSSKKARVSGSAGIAKRSAVEAAASNNASATVMAELLAANTTNRAAVTAAMATLTTSASTLDASTGDAFVAAVQGVLDALVASIADPADAIALLTPLASYTPEAFTSSSAIGDAQATAQAATSALLRRLSLVAIAQVVARYAPASSDEALATLATVTVLVDAEITVAGDAGDDESYAALRALRQGVVTALTTTGATLPQLQTFTFKAPMPALVMANRLYGDAERQDELVQQADPIHPAFMPVTVKALAN